MHRGVCFAPLPAGWKVFERIGHVKKTNKTRGLANKAFQNTHEATEDFQDNHKNLLKSPTMPQDGPKMSPRWRQDPLTDLNMPSKSCQVAPRYCQDPFKTTLGCPSPPPRRPKTRQYSPKALQLQMFPSFTSDELSQGCGTAGLDSSENTLPSKPARADRVPQQ